MGSDVHSMEYRYEEVLLQVLVNTEEDGSSRVFSHLYSVGVWFESRPITGHPEFPCGTPLLLQVQVWKLPQKCHDLPFTINPTIHLRY
jgi:hypothetical protein